MSDDAKFEAPGHKVTLEPVTMAEAESYGELFDTACFSCGHNNWLLLTNGAVAAVTMFPVVGQTQMGVRPSHLPSLAAVCDNCATVWFISIEHRRVIAARNKGRV